MLVDPSFEISYKERPFNFTLDIYFLWKKIMEPNRCGDVRSYGREKLMVGMYSFC